MDIKPTVVRGVCEECKWLETMQWKRPLNEIQLVVAMVYENKNWVELT